MNHSRPLFSKVTRLVSLIGLLSAGLFLITACAPSSLSSLSASKSQSQSSSTSSNSRSSTSQSSNPNISYSKPNDAGIDVAVITNYLTSQGYTEGQISSHGDDQKIVLRAGQYVGSKETGTFDYDFQIMTTKKLDIINIDIEHMTDVSRLDNPPAHLKVGDWLLTIDTMSALNHKTTETLAILKSTSQIPANVKDNATTSSATNFTIVNK